LLFHHGRSRASFYSTYKTVPRWTTGVRWCRTRGSETDAEDLGKAGRDQKCRSIFFRAECKGGTGALVRTDVCIQQRIHARISEIVRLQSKSCISFAGEDCGRSDASADCPD